jgi:ketosteroid isomerase-like protein
MSQENVEIVRRIYNEVSAGQWKAPPDLFDRRYEVDLTDAGPDLGVIRGVEATETALREYTETFENFRIELLDVIHADDEYVITAVRDGGRLKGSDSEVWNRFFHVWRFHDGRVRRRSSHRNKEEALEAAGLSEQDAHADS